MLLPILFSASVFAVGCNQKKSTAQQLRKVEQSTAQAAQDMKDYAFAQRADFVEMMQGEITALNRDLDQLNAKVENSSDKIKADAQPRLQALREQTAVLNKQLDDAKHANESTWDIVKADFRKTYEASKKDLQQARQWLSDKIAP